MAFKTLNFSNKDLQLFQDNVASALPADATTISISIDASGNKHTIRNQVASLFSGGTLITIPLTTGADNLIPHGLDRQPVVWAVMGIDSNATVWSPVTATLKNSSGASQSANSSYLNLRCSANCTVTVWVN